MRIGARGILLGQLDRSRVGCVTSRRCGLRIILEVLILH